MGHDSWRVSVRRRIIALFVALATLLAGGIIAETATTTASAATTSTRDSYSSTVGNSTFEAARNKYGLAKEMRDGATLHAFEWSFKTIEENIPDIAAAGYTSVQTEPIQKISRTTVSSHRQLVSQLVLRLPAGRYVNRQLRDGLRG
ncbi:hypothetical protein [Bifidobacterium boum]|uniref:hypothetical protein n=1 Tax=Bifidobacterium boum TaxID=78343 RepID=UPI003F923EEC